MAQFFMKYGNQLFIIILWVLMMAYLLIIPRKRKKKYQEMLSNLKEGTEIITTGGIKGTISSISPEYITIRVAKGVNIQITKGAISRVLP